MRNEIETKWNSPKWNEIKSKRNKSKRNGIIQNEIKNILRKKIVHCFPGYIKTRGSAHWACIAHLTIEWYWSKFQREIIITLKNSSHLEWRVGLSDTILKGTLPGTIYARFGPYINASCQVWLHLTKLFQRRRFF